jgi:hypothetical protein
MFTVISFYTPNWKYAEAAEQLRQDCQRLSIPCVIEELPDLGDWVANTRQKTQFVYQQLLRLESPVLWVDADCRIYHKPIIDVNYDIGMVRKSGKSERTFFASSLFFNYTPASLAFVKRWAEYQGEGSDHYALEMVWREGLNASLIELPSEYCDLSYSSRTVIGVGLSQDPKKLAYLEQKRKTNMSEKPKLTKVRATAHFSSSQFGTFVPGEVFNLPYEVAQRYQQNAFVEPYETKPHVEIPSIPSIAGTEKPSSSLPAAPVSPERTPKKRGRKPKGLSA